MAAAADEDLAEYIPHDEFRAGVAHGRFRLVVNPKLARRYIARRLLLLVLLMPLIGVGLALALSGATWAGGLMVAAGVVLNRVVMWQAPKMVVHMATRDASVYDFVTGEGIMEVRRV